eukprot:249734-Rhodomonas_salina.2
MVRPGWSCWTRSCSSTARNSRWIFPRMRGTRRWDDYESDEEGLDDDDDDDSEEKDERVQDRVCKSVCAPVSSVMQDF